MKNRPLLIGEIALIFWLTSCSVITPIVTPAIDVYSISPEIKQSETSADMTAMKFPSAVILALSSIRSPQEFMTTGIIYRDADYGFNSYAYSRWSDSPSKLLEYYLQQSLAKSQYVLAIIPSSSRSEHDLLLEATLVDFSHHLVTRSPSSTAVVSIIFYLINPEGRILLATKQFTEEVILEQDNAKGATRAINQASKIVADGVQAWLAVEIANAAQE